MNANGKGAKKAWPAGHAARSPSKPRTSNTPESERNPATGNHRSTPPFDVDFARKVLEVARGSSDTTGGLPLTVVYKRTRTPRFTLVEATHSARRATVSISRFKTIASESRTGRYENRFMVHSSVLKQEPYETKLNILDTAWYIPAWKTALTY